MHTHTMQCHSLHVLLVRWCLCALAGFVGLEEAQYGYPLHACPAYASLYIFFLSKYAFALSRFLQSLIVDRSNMGAHSVRNEVCSFQNSDIAWDDSDSISVYIVTQPTSIGGGVSLNVIVC